MRRYLQDRRPLLSTFPTVGVVAVSDEFVAVAVRDDPVRITGAYRSRLDVLGGIDRSAALAAAAADARRVLRVPNGTPAVLALSPVSPNVRCSLHDSWADLVVEVEADAPTADALEAVGLTVERFDAVPAALARFAWASTRHGGRLNANGWAVSVTTDALEARIVPDSQLPGTPGGSPGVSYELRGVHVPAAIGRFLDDRSDAAAIGAALRGHRYHPDVPALAVEKVVDRVHTYS